MFHSPRHNHEFSFGNEDLLLGSRGIAIIHSEGAMKDEKHFIRVLMMMPHELALELDQFDFLAVQHSYDSGVPVVLKACKFLA